MKVCLFKTVILIAIFTIATPVFADGFRTWKSQNQQHSVEARFDDFDTNSNQVTLLDRDGNTIDVKLDQLSTSDQKYVLRRHNKLAAEKTAGKNPFKKVRRESKERSRSSNRNLPSVARWGIQWTPRLENAQLAATGNNSSPADDRPIMWFRVLGNLEGFM